MKFNELPTTKKKSKTRVGRGISAGKGKTAGRGTKGQSSRSGGKVRPGFEGGQNPVYMKIPKLPGFRSIRSKAENVYTNQLNDLTGPTVDNFTLFNENLISSPYVKVKLITKGDLKKKLNIKLQSASKSAIEQIQKAGGKFESVEQVKRSKKEQITK